MHLTRFPPPESPEKGMRLDTGAGWAGVAFSKKEKRKERKAGVSHVQ